MRSDFATRGEDGLMDLAAYRNYVSFVDKKHFRDVAYDAHEEYVTRERVSNAARSIFGEIEQ